MEHQRKPEIRMEGGYRDQMAHVFEHLFPKAARERSVREQEDLAYAYRAREKAVRERPILEIGHEYGANLDGLRFEYVCEYPISADEEERMADGESIDIQPYDEVYSLPVRSHFSDRRLPAGYGYKGGAARALLLRTLGIDPSYTPRDIDVIRFAHMDDSDNLDKQVGREFMADDFQDGHGVEVIEQVDEYFTTRDLSINEVWADDTHIECTRRALFDTMRRIIRPTQFEDGIFGGGLGPKMLAKVLRFYSEMIERYDEVGIADVENWQFEEGFIAPFWLAIQLDRAYDVGEGVALRYVRELAKHGQIPHDIDTIEEGAKYLLGLVYDFSYRHAPTEQFEMEDHWAQKIEDDKKSRRGVVRKIGKGHDGQDDERTVVHGSKTRKQARRIKDKMKEVDE